MSVLYLGNARTFKQVSRYLRALQSDGTINDYVANL